LQAGLECVHTQSIKSKMEPFRIGQGKGTGVIA
jgi:hypothetical protein